MVRIKTFLKSLFMRRWSSSSSSSSSKSPPLRTLSRPLKKSKRLIFPEPLPPVFPPQKRMVFKESERISKMKNMVLKDSIEIISVKKKMSRQQAEKIADQIEEVLIFEDDVLPIINWEVEDSYSIEDSIELVYKILLERYYISLQKGNPEMKLSDIKKAISQLKKEPQSTIRRRQPQDALFSKPVNVAKSSTSVRRNTAVSRNIPVDLRNFMDEGIFQ